MNGYGPYLQNVRDSSDILAPARYSGKPSGFGRNAQKNICASHYIIYICGARNNNMNPQTQISCFVEWKCVIGTPVSYKVDVLVIGVSYTQ